MARQAYLATIAARARGTAAALVPPSVPMRGWDGAWPAELPPAAVVTPAMVSSPSPEPAVVRLRSSEPAPSAPRDLDAGASASAAPAERPGPAAPLRARGSSTAELVAAPEIREAPASVAHEAPIPPRVETPAQPPRADRSAIPRIDEVATPPARAVAPGGMPEPLRVASRAERVADPEAARSAPASVRLSPAAALHAAFQWVSAPATERLSSAAPAGAAPEPAGDASRAARSPRSEALTAERVIAGAGAGADTGAGARAPAARREALAPVLPAPDRTPPPRTLHIGSIEVEIQTPRDGADRDMRAQHSAPAAPAAPLARGFTTPLGLRQG